MSFWRNVVIMARVISDGDGDGSNNVCDVSNVSNNVSNVSNTHTH
jgi:hypothetical protein